MQKASLRDDVSAVAAADVLLCHMSLSIARFLPPLMLCHTSHSIHWQLWITDLRVTHRLHSSKVLVLNYFSRNESHSREELSVNGGLQRNGMAWIKLYSQLVCSFVWKVCLEFTMHCPTGKTYKVEIFLKSWILILWGFCSLIVSHDPKTQADTPTKP